MIEKLEDCPICGAALSQVEYDMQTHSNHWVTLPPIFYHATNTRLREQVKTLREAIRISCEQSRPFADDTLKDALAATEPKP